MYEFEVTLSKGGRHITVTVFAESTRRTYKQQNICILELDTELVML